MHLMILENQRLRNTLRTNGGTVTVGSDPKCHVHLPDPRLGKHQVSLSQDDDGIWWLEVLDHALPTSLNRAIQKSRAKLRHADEIEIGSFSLRFFIDSDRSREELQHERLVALTKRHGETLPLGAIILKENDDMSVSREQLEQMTLLAMRISQAESVGDTLAAPLRALLRTFDAKRAWAAVRKGERGEFDWMLGLSRKGKPCPRPSFSNTTQPRCLDYSQHLCIPDVPVEGVGSAMSVPLVGQTGNIGMLYIENDKGDEPYDETSLNVFKALGSCIAMPIETVMRQSMAIRRAAAQTELTIARATQDALMPNALPTWDKLQVAAYRHMGSRRCCDFYDIVQLRDKTAAIILAKLQVDLHALPRYLSELRAAFRLAALYSEAPHLFARAVNWILYAPESNNRIDLAAAWVCPQTGQVQHSFAGNHVVGGRIHADGTCEMIQSEATPAIGQTRAPTFESKTFTLAVGDSLVMATDGVESAKNPQAETFGLEGLKDNLCDGLGDTPSHVLNELATDLSDYVTGGENPDDSTVVLLRRE